MNIHLQQLIYLREVARCGSIIAAAENLDVSQPALSQALNELSRRLNAPLFERAGRGRRLTQAGREALRYAEETLAAAEALRRRLDELQEGEGGTLAVGMIDAAGLYVLPEVLRGYRDAHPRVELKLVVDTSEELLRRLRGFDLDLCFVVGPVEEADLVAVEVLREPLYLYAPPGAGDDPRGVRWVLYPEGSRTRGIIDTALACAGITPSVALESHNPAVLRQMVAIGLGWSVLPAAIVDEAPERGAVRVGNLLTERPLCATWRAGSPPDPRRTAFLDLALAQARA